MCPLKRVKSNLGVVDFDGGCLAIDVEGDFHEVSSGRPPNLFLPVEVLNAGRSLEGEEGVARTHADANGSLASRIFVRIAVRRANIARFLMPQSRQSPAAESGRLQNYEPKIPCSAARCSHSNQLRPYRVANGLPRIRHNLARGCGSTASGLGTMIAECLGNASVSPGSAAPRSWEWGT